MNFNRRSLTLALTALALASVSALPLDSFAAAAKPAASASVLPPDNAPFWTGRPKASQFKARIRTRLKRAQASLAVLTCCA